MRVSTCRWYERLHRPRSFREKRRAKKQQRRHRGGKDCKGGKGEREGIARGENGTGCLQFVMLPTCMALGRVARGPSKKRDDRVVQETSPSSLSLPSLCRPSPRTVDSIFVARETPSLPIRPLEEESPGGRLPFRIPAHEYTRSLAWEFLRADNISLSDLFFSRRSATLLTESHVSRLFQFTARRTREKSTR